MIRMKKLIYILTAILTSACMDISNADPYAGSLNVLKVTADWP